MTDRAARKRPGDATHGSRAGQRAGNGHKHKENGGQEAEGTWTPGRARHAPKEKASTATMFERLAKAAAAHDGETPAGIFGESG